MKSSLTPVLTCERTVYGYILRRSRPSMRLAAAQGDHAPAERDQWLTAGHG